MKTAYTHKLWAAPAPQSLDLDFAGECSIVEAAPGADGAKPLPRFSMVAYTGGPMRPKVTPPLKHPVIVDLAGLDISSQNRPALKDHDSRRLIGHTDSISTDGRQLMAAGVISGVGADAREVVAASQNGFTWQVSMGSHIGDLELIPANSSVQVNGQHVAGPVYVARSGRVRELSFLTLGADDNTSARIAAEAAERTSMTFEQWLQAKGFALADLNDQTKQYLQAQFDSEASDTGATEPEPDATVQAGAGDDETVDAVADHRKMLANERRRAASFARIEAQYAAQVPAEALHTIAAQATEEGWTTDKFELALIRKRRPEAGGATGTTGRATKRAKLSAAVVTAALSLTAGIDEDAIAKQFAAAEREQVMNEATSGAMRGYSLHALMDHVIHATGGHFSGSRKSNDYIRAALSAERSLAASHDLQADGFSTLSLSGILSNVANKGLIASYSAVDVIWPFFCAVRNHGDFKVHTRYRLDSTGAFKKVAADGEIKNVGLDNASYTNKLETYGAIISLTRQMMVNDDLGAFMEIPHLLGRMAALRIEEAVFVLLLSNSGSFFSTTNANNYTGAGSALSITSLTTAVQKFTDFVDSNGKPILTNPDRLITGSALRVVAQQLNQQTTVIATGVPTAAAATAPNNNPHAGLYKPYVSPYLSNTAIKDQDGNALSGQSSTLWYLFADPAVRAAIAVAFLNGQRTPTIESSQTEFDTLGMQWRAYEDMGVGFEDPTAAVRVVGA